MEILEVGLSPIAATPEGSRAPFLDVAPPAVQMLEVGDDLGETGERSEPGRTLGDVHVESRGRGESRGAGRSRRPG